MTLKIQDFWYFFKSSLKIFPGVARIIGKILHNLTETKGIRARKSSRIKVLNCDLVWGKKEPYFRVESLLGADRVTFDVLRARLIQQVKVRINNGEFTERGLARLLGISQSQTHNVLKGARKLQMHLADRILTKLEISAVDLLNDGELDAALRRKMTDWDREIAAAGETDLANTGLALEELFAIKRPAGRSETSSDLDVRKTG